MVLYNVENISKKPKMPKNYQISNVCKEGQISSKCLISFAECLILCHNIRICSKILIPSNFANLYPPLVTFKSQKSHNSKPKSFVFFCVLHSVGKWQKYNSECAQSSFPQLSSEPHQKHYRLVLNRSEHFQMRIQIPNSQSKLSL